MFGARVTCPRWDWNSASWSVASLPWMPMWERTQLMPVSRWRLDSSARMILCSMPGLGGLPLHMHRAWTVLQAAMLSESRRSMSLSRFDSRLIAMPSLSASATLARRWNVILGEKGLRGHNLVGLDIGNLGNYYDWRPYQYVNYRCHKLHVILLTSGRLAISSMVASSKRPAYL